MVRYLKENNLYRERVAGMFFVKRKDFHEISILIYRNLFLILNFFYKKKLIIKILFVEQKDFIRS